MSTPIIFSLERHAYIVWPYLCVLYPTFDFLFIYLQSAVTWLCFSPNSEEIITSSKDGTMRVWNINGMSNSMDFIMMLHFT